MSDAENWVALRDWSRPNTTQIGRYAKEVARAAFAAHKFRVAESDRLGIAADFVATSPRGLRYGVVVRSLRLHRDAGYMFFLKSKFTPRDDLLAVVVLFWQGRDPEMFLIPSRDWIAPNAMLVDRDYVGAASAPEYGINLSGATRPLLNGYRFDDRVRVL